MEEVKRWQIPSFGRWGDYYYEEESLFNRMALPLPLPLEELTYYPYAFPFPCCDQCCPKVRKAAVAAEEDKSERKQRKQSSSFSKASVQRHHPMAVDEDLYKIPPELLCPKPNRKKRVLTNLFSGCITLNCLR